MAESVVCSEKGPVVGGVVDKVQRVDRSLEGQMLPRGPTSSNWVGIAGGRRLSGGLAAGAAGQHRRGLRSEDCMGAGGQQRAGGGTSGGYHGGRRGVVDDDG
jgi:hypothetical protein